MDFFNKKLDVSFSETKTIRRYEKILTDVMSSIRETYHCDILKITSMTDAFIAINLVKNLVSCVEQINPKLSAEKADMVTTDGLTRTYIALIEYQCYNEPANKKLRNDIANILGLKICANLTLVFLSHNMFMTSEEMLEYMKRIKSAIFNIMVYNPVDHTDDICNMIAAIMNKNPV